MNVEKTTLSPEKPKCFVISPIGQVGSETRSQMDVVFHCIIKPALEERYKVVRADHVARPGRITEQFIEDILTNDLIVCILTGNNPNVFYELGIAESAARPIIVLKDKNGEIPFDVKDVRCIDYDLDPRRIYDEVYVSMVKDAVRELDKNFKGEVPFGKHLTPLGAERLNFRIAERYDLLSSKVDDILESAKNRFYFCGLSLRGWTGNEGFVAKLKEKAEHIECKIMVMDPDNPSVSELLNSSMVNQIKRIKDDIKSSIETIHLYQQEIPNLQIRAIKRGVLHQQMAMSENSMIWAPHLHHKQTGQAPAVIVDLIESNKNDTSFEHLFKAMRNEFENLWAEAGPYMKPEETAKN